MARFIDELRRTHDCGALRKGDIGKEVVLFGWVANRRDHGSLVFIDLRDREGITQVVFDPDSSRDAHALAEQFRSEWVIGIRGTISPSFLTCTPRNSFLPSNSVGGNPVTDPRSTWNTPLFAATAAWTSVHSGLPLVATA